MTEERPNETREEVEVERMDEANERLCHSPRVDIYEDGDDLVLMVDIPGVKSDGLEVDYEDGVLSINGRSNREPAAEGIRIRREYVSGDYHRCFRVSEDIDVEKVTAKVADGVLTLRLPKAARARKRRIEVK